MTARSTVYRGRSLLGLGLLALATAAGCQASIGGQTLPSPYWTQDDVQYFGPGPEFKLAREAAQMKAYNAEVQFQKSQQQ